MIEQLTLIRYRAVCDSCGWGGSAQRTEKMAENVLTHHKCNEHRELYDSSGNYRGVLGGFNRYCSCGVLYTSDGLEPFNCPAATKREPGSK